MKQNKAVWQLIFVSCAVLLLAWVMIMLIPYIWENITVPWVNAVGDFLGIDSFAGSWTVAIILDILTIPLIILIVWIVRYSIKWIIKNK